MALGQMVFSSQEMNRNVSFAFILPGGNSFIEKGNPHYKRKTKTLYLLHGHGNCQEEWLTGSSIKELADIYNLAVIMPSGENSFYLNQKAAKRNYADYVGEELVAYTRKIFDLSTDKADTFVGGLSMGGFGALHTGLAYNHNFSKIMALSSALILHNVAGQKEDFKDSIGDYDYYTSIFGDLEKLLISRNNPEQIIRDLQKAGEEIPKIYMACGTKDFLIEENRQFKRFLDDNMVPVEYYESEGDHDFRFWNQYLESAIQWMIK